MSFFNKYGLLNAASSSNKDRVDENTLMYSMLYILTTGKGVKEHDEDYSHFLKLCEVDTGIYLQRPELGGENYSQKDRYMSHDQLTSIVSYLSMKGRTVEIQEIYDQFSLMRYDNLNPKDPTWMQIQHPRDIFYIKSLLGSRISKLFCFLLTLIELNGVYKLRPLNTETGLKKVYHEIRRALKFKNPEHDNIMVETDSKLLAFIRLSTWNNNTYWKIAQYVMRKREVLRSFQECFRYYFKKYDHPLHLNNFEIK